MYSVIEQSRQAARTQRNFYGIDSLRLGGLALFFIFRTNSYFETARSINAAATDGSKSITR